MLDEGEFGSGAEGDGDREGSHRERAGLGKAFLLDILRHYAPRSRGMDLHGVDFTRVQGDEQALERDEAVLREVLEIVISSVISDKTENVGDFGRKKHWKMYGK